MFYKFSRFICYLAAKMFFHLEIQGEDNFKKVKGAVYAVNHASYLDPVLAGVSTLRPVYYLARKTLFRTRFSNWLLRNVNAVPFNRDAADSSTLRKVIQLLKEDKIVLVFPEGTRSLDGRLQKAHAGVGFIVLKSGVPVVPAYVHGSYKIFPKNRKFFKIAKARVTIGEPIYFDAWLKKERIEKSDYEAVADLIMKKIALLAEK